MAVFPPSRKAVCQNRLLERQSELAQLFQLAVRVQHHPSLDEYAQDATATTEPKSYHHLLAVCENAAGNDEGS